MESRNRGSTALVVLEGGAVVHEYFAGGVNEHTLFPTASLSKWITALSVMSLVEQGRLDLDHPVSRYLTRWQLPESPFDPDQVTARRLLSRTAGLSGSTATIAVGQEPGAGFLYSGGGYLTLELLVEEVTGGDFTEHVRRSILDPVGMRRSSYGFPGELHNVTRSFALDGSAAPAYRYASAAATGFASSASDLTRLVKALTSEDSVPLDAATLRATRQAHGFVLGAGIWGLGTMLYAGAPQGGVVFGHDGDGDRLGVGAVADRMPRLPLCRTCPRQRARADRARQPGHRPGRGDPGAAALSRHAVAAPRCAPRGCRSKRCSAL